MSKAYAFPKFPTASNSLHLELKKRVQEYFDTNELSHTSTKGMVFKALILMASFWAVYLHLILGTQANWVAVIECVLLGCIIAAIGFNIMHDGNHGSFSRKKVINTLASYSGSMLGASQFMWNLKHNVIHHTYTNVEGVDDDIEVGKFMKLAPAQKHYAMHKYQYIYFVPLYMLLYLFWVFVTDYKKYFTRKIGDYNIRKIETSQHLLFWGGKIIHAMLFVVIPIILVGWLNWLIGLLIIGMVSGFVLSIVFQLAHTVPDTEFPKTPDTQQKMPYEFAVHQILTTANFATNSKVVSWLVGGLNFQIEHHLFPKISHAHYPAISKIVKSVCSEYNIKYNEYKTTLQAVAAHVKFLKQMGRA